MTNNITIMLTMIERVLSGQWLFTDFKNAYYDFYLDSVTDKELDDLPDIESAFFLQSMKN
jgi:hypothetical protein